ncbi:uncharacterized protein LOC117174756 [Belonocnema kinseyi]|uniref:uncharacterized protein LOC117174756 n=1 Tax=Belonocnema kinseyi TaxID=2817044 RepID=UPI00143D9940|nr:uncharacterized protein LOC117174756 [Belonocnema kinseyi]
MLITREDIVKEIRIALIRFTRWKIKKNQLRLRDIRIKDINEHFFGQMNVTCVHCGAMHFAAEKVANKRNSFNDCCGHGEVKLEPLPAPPMILRDLFNRTHEQTNHFHQRIRCYNNSFAFAAFNANLVNFNNNRRAGRFCLEIFSQVYYQINTSLYPSVDHSPSYGQLFIIDENEATNIRCNHTSTLNLDVTNDIDNALRECNVFSKSYQICTRNYKKTIVEVRNKFKYAMSRDFQRNYNIQEAYIRSYIQINTYLSYERFDISRFPTMPQITEFRNDIEIHDDEVSLTQHEQLGQTYHSTTN